MSVGEIMNLQASRPGMSNAEWIRQGRLHAVGRYQMIGPTFARVVQAMGIKPNQQFTLNYRTKWVSAPPQWRCGLINGLVLQTMLRL